MLAHGVRPANILSNPVHCTLQKGVENDDAAQDGGHSTPHPSDVLDMPVDPNEPTYCLCHQVSYGEMIGCDNPDVRITNDATYETMTNDVLFFTANLFSPISSVPSNGSTLRASV